MFFHYDIKEAKTQENENLQQALQEKEQETKTLKHALQEMKLQLQENKAVLI